MKGLIMTGHKISKAEQDFAYWCKRNCTSNKGCKARKNATQETSWLDLKAQCPELKKITQRLNSNLI